MGSDGSFSGGGAGGYGQGGMGGMQQQQPTGSTPYMTPQGSQPPPQFSQTPR